MLDILRLDITKDLLRKMAKEERCLFLALGHASNQVNALWKLVIRGHHDIRGSLPSKTFTIDYWQIDVFLFSGFDKGVIPKRAIAAAGGGRHA
jgi:hypothetical protein